MYAVVATGGKQYKVEKGNVLRIESVKGKIGSDISFDNVVMFSDGENVKIGQPNVDDVAVRGRIISQSKSKKIIVFKYKKRKGYRRKYGHRQPYTAVLIEELKSVLM